MAKRVLKATHEGVMDIGGVQINCAVLEGEVRVLSLRSFMSALGYRSVPNVQGGATANSLIDYLPATLASSIDQGSRRDCKLIPYQPLPSARGGPQSALGVKDDALAVVCEAVLRARDAGQLRVNQAQIAERADVLIRGLARTGIHALVDEATGYQEVRDKAALQKILARFITEEMRPWVKTFPDDFYTEIARLHKWEGDILSGEKPGIVGHYTNDLVYQRLAPGVLDALHGLVGRNEKGKLVHKLHQHLTAEDGLAELKGHFGKLIVLMQVSSSWDSFMRRANKTLPAFNRTLTLPLEDPDDD